jgi:two-component system sensor histidine kinase VanS
VTRLLSLRSRLFLAFVVALVASGALMVTIVYLGMRFVPTYELVPAMAHTGGPLPPAANKLPGPVVVRSEQDIWTMALATSVAAMLLVTVVGLTVGRVVVRRLLAPLQAVNRAAATAGTGHLDHRINATGPADELKELADTFDAMLDELQELLAAHQRFAANASHELLTP